MLLFRENQSGSGILRFYRVFMVATVAQDSALVVINYCALALGDLASKLDGDKYNYAAMGTIGFVLLYY